MSSPVVLRWWAKALLDMTPAEKALEPAVAALGVRYRCQHPLLGFKYRVDFALLDHHLVIEVDDPGHDRKSRRREDELRTAALKKAGWRVVRCTNAEALRWPYATVNKLLIQAGIPLVAEPPDRDPTGPAGPTPPG